MLIVGLRLVSRGKSRCFLWREMHTLWPLAPLLHLPLYREGFVHPRALPVTETSSWGGREGKLIHLISNNSIVTVAKGNNHYSS